MLAPLRDHLRPKDPLSSPLLFTAKESYFTRLSAKREPFMPGSKETEWITSEDANVEHLFDVLTSVDTNSDHLWGACVNFLNLLYWHKPRQTVLGSKINQLPDDNNFKSKCLLWVSKSFESLGNRERQKQLLEHALKLESERGNEDGVAFILAELSRAVGTGSEGIRRAKESLGIFERISDVGKQGHALNNLAWVLYANEELDAAETAASRAIQLLSEDGQEFRVCDSHLFLGRIYQDKGEREKAIFHLKMTLEITSHFGWISPRSFMAHRGLAVQFLLENKSRMTHVLMSNKPSHTRSITDTTREMWPSFWL
jgi:tetratricopeptide (TPR) repeat protein